jgi:hypothetical protein
MPVRRRGSSTDSGARLNAVRRTMLNISRCSPSAWAICFPDAPARSSGQSPSTPARSTRAGLAGRRRRGSYRPARSIWLFELTSGTFTPRTTNCSQAAWRERKRARGSLHRWRNVSRRGKVADADRDKLAWRSDQALEPSALTNQQRRGSALVVGPTTRPNDHRRRGFQ